MSAQFYLTFGGVALFIVGKRMKPVDKRRATVFTSEAEAWGAAQANGLEPALTEVCDFTTGRPVMAAGSTEAQVGGA